MKTRKNSMQLNLPTQTGGGHGKKRHIKMGTVLTLEVTKTALISHNQITSHIYNLTDKSFFYNPLMKTNILKI